MKNFSEYALFGNDIDYAENWDYLIKTLNNLKIESILNVGIGNMDGSDARKWNYFLVKECPTIKKIINLEINNKFCENIKQLNDPLLSNIILGDIRTFSTENLDIDLVFWSHGPEHIQRHEWLDCFKRIEKLANKSVILQMPWGSGYDFMNEHVSKNIRKGEIEDFGYECYYQGIEHTLNASLVGIKIK